MIEDPLAEGMLEQRFLANTTIYVTAEAGLLRLSSQDEYDAAQTPTKKSRKKKSEEADRELELSSAGAGAGGEGKE